jgi:hypothetical protein
MVTTVWRHGRALLRRTELSRVSAFKLLGDGRWFTPQIGAPAVVVRPFLALLTAYFGKCYGLALACRWQSDETGGMLATAAAAGQRQAKRQQSAPRTGADAIQRTSLPSTAQRLSRHFVS